MAELQEADALQALPENLLSEVSDSGTCHCR